MQNIGWSQSCQIIQNGPDHVLLGHSRTLSTKATLPYLQAEL